MEHNFKSPPYSLGVEEEFQIVGRESYALVSRIDEILPAFEGEEHEARVKPELLQSVIEVATHVAGTVAEAVEDLRDLRARLRQAAADQDALIASAGTHPFSRYEHQKITDRARYLELAQELRWLIVRQLIFGLHIHVGLDSGHKAIACVNGVRTHLPELLALSANSPFWEGRATGLASTRIKVFDGLLRSGLPPAFASFEEFELLVERGIKTNVFPDYTHIWWDVRPHPKLGTVEIRICDAQTRLGSVAAIAALAQSLVATIGAAFDAGERSPLQPVTLIEENKWRASRDGLGAQLIDLEHDTERPARQAVGALIERCEEQARRLGCAGELESVGALLERGSGADEQVRVYEDTDSLLAVAQWLVAETVRDV